MDNLLCVPYWRLACFKSCWSLSSWIRLMFVTLNNLFLQHGHALIASIKATLIWINLGVQIDILLFLFLWLNHENPFKIIVAYFNTSKSALNIEIVQFSSDILLKLHHRNDSLNLEMNDCRFPYIIHQRVQWYAKCL